MDFIKITDVETGEVEISELIPAEEALKILKESLRNEKGEFDSPDGWNWRADDRK